MHSIEQFLQLVSLFCAARGISEARASTLILNGGSRITAIRAGQSDIGIRRLDEAIQYLSSNWPEGAEWPPEIPRPSPPAVVTQSKAEETVNGAGLPR